ncbi:MAG: hypothetical protein LBT53_04225 [Puniceicoccales bacterium]|jgi:hypothetical protein|nr:hypothetical protein [Puniceicoccales bacterium]
MSNPYNRRQTLGAYGKPKPTLFKRAVPGSKQKTAAPASQPHDPNAFNISDALINFARPVIDQAGNNHTAIRGAMNVAILVWNALIDGGPAISKAREKLLGLPGANSEQIDELLAVLSERKATLYPNVKQLVNKYDLSFTKRGASIRLSAINVAPEGVEKTDMALLLGAVPSVATTAAANAPEDIPPTADAAPDLAAAPAAAANDDNAPAAAPTPAA